MLDDSMPNFQESSPQDNDLQENEEDEIDDIQEVPVQQPEIIVNNNISQMNSIPYQNTMNENQYQYQNNVDDILLRSSQDIFDSSNPTFSTQILNNNSEQLEPQMAQPIYESNNPLENMAPMGKNTEYNDNINNINNNYIYQVEINKPMLESQYNSQFNNNNSKINNSQYATVKPINDINEITNNNQINEVMNPQYIPKEQNIIYSTPIPQKTNIINNSIGNINNNNINYSAPFSQSMPIISPINYVNNLNTPNKNYISNFDNGNENINMNNISNMNTGMNNLNLSNSKNEVTIKLTGKNPNVNNNINNSNFLRAKPQQKNDKNFENFSPDSWMHFYPENEPFFTSMDFSDSIPNQRIENSLKNEIYIGQINRAGQKHGFGKLYSPLYERIGTWVNDKFQGWGREIRKNGEIYEGKFENDILNGKGKYKSGNTLYLGNFRNYNKHGKGELFTEEYHYIGNFNNNRFNGEGRIEIYGRGVYEGDFREDKMTGYGIFKYNDGKFYEGNIVDGKKEGYGKLMMTNGKIYKGFFSNDEYKGNNNSKNKNYQYTSNNRKKYE